MIGAIENDTPPGGARLDGKAYRYLLLKCR
jgi:hypothetical protein